MHAISLHKDTIYKKLCVINDHLISLIIGVTQGV